MNTAARTWTIVELLRWGTDYFAARDVDSPRLSVELLLCHVTGLQRIDLYVQHDKPLADAELVDLRSMIKRRAKGEPLQYILGSVEFLGCTIAVETGVLIPRPETEFIVDDLCKRLESNKDRRLRILDIGCGSGCISVALARAYPLARVLALDVSEQALSIAERNAVTNKVENVVFRKCDILSQMPRIQAPFDVIVSNPPYIAHREVAQLQREVRDYEPLNALTDHEDGLSFYRRFAEIFPQMLAPEGLFCLEFADGASGELAEMFTKAGYTCDVLRDLRDEPKALLGSRAANTRPSNELGGMT